MLYQRALTLFLLASMPLLVRSFTLLLSKSASQSSFSHLRRSHHRNLLRLSSSSSDAGSDATSDVGRSPNPLGMKEEVDPGSVEGTDFLIVKYPHPSLRHVNEECTEEEVRLRR